MLSDDIEEQGLTWVGRPMELVRTLDPVYLDQAEHDFAAYVSSTLAGSQREGGRFNPKGEFGALYTASDEDTAWEEIAARYRREGVDRLPHEMGVIGLLVLSGRFADLVNPDIVSLWEIDPADLASPTPSDAQNDLCWEIGRAVRAVADFLRSASARAGGANVPLFPDRETSQLIYRPQYFVKRAPPDHLRQVPHEQW